MPCSVHCLTYLSQHRHKALLHLLPYCSLQLGHHPPTPLFGRFALSHNMNVCHFRLELWLYRTNSWRWRFGRRTRGLGTGIGLFLFRIARSLKLFSVTTASCSGPLWEEDTACCLEDGNWCIRSEALYSLGLSAAVACGILFVLRHFRAPWKLCLAPDPVF